MAKFIRAEDVNDEMLVVRLHVEDGQVAVLVNDLYVVTIREDGILRPRFAHDCGLPLDEHGRVVLVGEEI